MNISSTYLHPDNQQNISKAWFKKIRDGKECDVYNNDGHVAYHDNMKDHHHIMTMNNLKSDDSAEYTFRLKQQKQQKHPHHQGERKESDVPGVTLVVTGNSVQ